jgi:hypothetical protein
MLGAVLLAFAFALYSGVSMFRQTEAGLRVRLSWSLLVSAPVFVVLLALDASIWNYHG